MTLRNLKLAVFLSPILITSTAWPQDASWGVNGNRDVQAATATKAVAWVYVSSSPQGSNTNQIVGYSAAANGSLTPLPGSPFPVNVLGMAVNGKYLMASSREAPNVNAYNIAPDGSLSFAAATNYAQYNACLLYTSPSPRDGLLSRMPSSA